MGNLISSFHLKMVFPVLLLLLAWPFLHALEKVEKSELLYFVDEEGRRRAIQDQAEWEQRRRQILAGMEEVMGSLPDMTGFPELNPQLVEEIRRDGYLRRKVLLQVEEDDLLSCYLLLPDKVRGRFPAVLALHPTHPMGKGDIVGISGRKNRNYGEELARLGFVVLAPDYPSFGDEKDYDFAHDSYLSGTMKGIVNHIRCVDYLQTLSFVDPQRIGVIGHSLGGHNALFTAAFDPRIKVIVSSCGWTPFHDYYQGNIEGWTSERYMPLLKTRYQLDPDLVPFDFYEVVAAMAPRPFLSISPERDSNFEVNGVRKAVREARKVYALLEAESNLQVEYPESEHDFIPEMRKRAYRFLAEGLDFEPPSNPWEVPVP